MRINYKQVLALALSFGFVLQAPVVALANDDDDSAPGYDSSQETTRTIPENTDQANIYESDNVDNVINEGGANVRIRCDIEDVTNRSSGTIYVGGQGGEPCDAEDVTNEGTGHVIVTGDAQNVTNKSDGQIIVYGDVTDTVTNAGTSQISDSSEVTGAFVYVGGNAETVKIEGTNQGVIVVDGKVNDFTENVDGNDRVYVNEVKENVVDKAAGVHFIIGTDWGIEGINIINYNESTDTVSSSYVASQISTEIDNVSYSRYWSWREQWLEVQIKNNFNLKDATVETIKKDGNRFYLQVPTTGGVRLTTEQIKAVVGVITEATNEEVVVVDNGDTIDFVPASVAAEENPAPAYVPDNTEGINVVNTNIGEALPTTELGNAGAPTKTLKMDISMVTAAQYKEAVRDTVKTVAAGGNLVLETNEVACFDRAMIETFAERNDVSYSIVFKDAGVKKLVIIPAGYDVRSLLDENGYCGFLRLAGILGYTVLEN